jgi:hypothetical protein
MNEKRSELQQALRVHRMNVVFDKLNGERRSMICTLNPEFLPESEKTKERKGIKYSDDVLRVFDLDKNAWRSFLVENFVSSSIYEPKSN